MGFLIQLLECGTKVLLRNAQRDGRKGGKFQKRWLGPYVIKKYLGKGVYKIANRVTGRVLKKAVNVCLLKVYNDPNNSFSSHDGSSSQHSSHDSSLSRHSSHECSRDGSQASHGCSQSSHGCSQLSHDTHGHSQSSHDGSQSSHGHSQSSHDGSQSSHDGSQSSHGRSQLSHDGSQLSHGRSQLSHGCSLLCYDGSQSSHGRLQSSHDDFLLSSHESQHPCDGRSASLHDQAGNPAQNSSKVQEKSFQDELEEFQGSISLDRKLQSCFAASSFIYEEDFYPDFLPQHESLSPIKKDGYSVEDRVINGMSACI